MRAGDEAIREIFQWAIGRADDAGLPYVDVTAKVEPRNVSSRKMLDRVGMKIYSVGFDPPYDLWGTRVDLEQDEAEPADAEPADAEPADAVPDGTGPGGDVGGDEPEPGSSSTR